VVKRLNAYFAKEFEGRMFQQTVGIPMGLTVHLFLFLQSSEAEFIQQFLRKGENKLAQLIMG